MPTYTPTFSPRYRLKYRQAGFEHTIQFRASRGTSLATMESTFNSFVTAFFSAAFLVRADDTVFISNQVAETDSDIFVPATALPAAPTAGAIDVATISPYMRAHGLTFNGSSPGSRARFTMFGTFWDVTDPANPAANGVITSVGSSIISTIADAATAVARAGSGQAAIFYHQATYKVNDHLLAEVRRLFL